MYIQCKVQKGKKKKVMKTLRTNRAGQFINIFERFYVMKIIQYIINIQCIEG